MNLMPPAERQRADLYGATGELVERRVNLRDQLRVLQGRWPTMVAAGVVVAGLVFAFTYFKTPVYTSTALVMISPQRERVVDNSSDVRPELGPDASVIESEIQVIRSRALAYRVIDELDLEKNPVWNPALAMPAIVDQIHAVLNLPVAAVRKILEPPTRDGAVATDADPVRESVADLLMASIKAQRRGISSEIEVSVSASRPREAAAVVNKLVKVYQASQLDTPVILRGVAPTRLTGPVLAQSLMIALLFGALVGLAVGGLLEALDDAMTSSDEVLSKVGAPALSVVPAVTESQMRRLSPDNRSPTGFLADNPMSGFAEAFRALRTTILRSDVGRPPKVVAVTSAAPGEGKTTTSVCLARITAASGQRVLLIDCDLRSRSLHQFIQGVPDKGLLQALIGDVPWRDLLKQDIDSAVHILPLAPTSIVPRGVLGSDAMRNFLAEAAAAYDLVICDCAPVLTGMETRVLARAADTTIVVARSGKTPARVVRDTVRQLRESGATIAGVVLNGLDPRSAASSSYDAPYVGKAYQKYYAS